MHSHHLMTNEDVFFTAVVLIKDMNETPTETSQYVYRNLPGRKIRFDYNVDYEVNRHALTTAGDFTQLSDHTLIHNIELSTWNKMHNIAVDLKDGLDYYDYE